MRQSCANTKWFFVFKRHAVTFVLQKKANKETICEFNDFRQKTFLQRIWFKKQSHPKYFIKSSKTLFYPSDSLLALSNNPLDDFLGIQFLLLFIEVNWCSVRNHSFALIVIVFRTDGFGVEHFWRTLTFRVWFASRESTCDM